MLELMRRLTRAATRWAWSCEIYGARNMELALRTANNRRDQALERCRRLDAANIALRCEVSKMRGLKYEPDYPTGGLHSGMLRQEWQRYGFEMGWLVAVEGGGLEFVDEELI
ncbi:MAG: hypothetical protein B7733_06165 [Myxococcales bacterium FL481]|nr:MAG: hypothetical protein B7733_06165 [Myxococcales bacterium FL481]